MQERRAEVGGVSMRWQELGEGLPLVLIHGIPTSPALWRRVAPRISGARCLAWEIPDLLQDVTVVRSMTDAEAAESNPFDIR